MTIANTILNQIGWHSLVMIGAKGFLALEAGVQMKVGKNAKSVKAIVVELAPNDTYTMKFYQNLMQEPRTVSEIYCDKLNEVIEQETGMATSL